MGPSFIYEILDVIGFDAREAECETRVVRDEFFPEFEDVHLRFLIPIVWRGIVSPTS